MSLTIQSGIHAVATARYDFESLSTTQGAAQPEKPAVATGKDAGPALKQAPKLDEKTQIEQLALQGHSNLEIAAEIGLPESVVALTLGDATTATSSSASSAAALVDLSGRLSITA